MVKFQPSLPLPAQQMPHWGFAALLVICCAVLAPGMTPSFSSDDYVHLIHNIHFKNFTDSLQVFCETYGREYRPMVRFSLWINSLMGDTALAFKLTNLFLHLSCTLLIYFLLLRLGAYGITALAGAAVFALHPIHITSIHFLLGRTDLLAASFYLGTLALVACWPSKPGFRHHLVTFICFALALLSKELSVTLPIAMGLILLAQNKPFSWRIFFAWASIQQILQKLWFYAVCVGVFVLIRIYLWQQLPGAISVYTNYSPSHIASNYAQWLFALLYPGDLYLAQDIFTETPKRFFLICSISLLVLGSLFTYLLWPNRKRCLTSPFFVLALAWLMLTLIPMSGGNPHRWYLYLPSTSLSLLLVGIWSLTNGFRRKILTFATLLLLGQYALESWQESRDWQQQSKLEINLLQQAKRLGLDKEKEVYFANIPFGYRGAFLFSHNSLSEALEVSFDQRTHIIPISYMNLDKQNAISITQGSNYLEFTLAPNAYRYFMLSASERRFTELTVKKFPDYTVYLRHLVANGKIASYRIERNQPNAAPLYYFDGNNLLRWTGNIE